MPTSWGPPRQMFPKRNAAIAGISQRIANRNGRRAEGVRFGGNKAGGCPNSVSTRSAEVHPTGRNVTMSLRYPSQVDSRFVVTSPVL